MKIYSAANIKNVALTGHGGSGKTSLAEALLFYTGSTDRLGRIADSNTVCDFDPEEIKRKTSVSSALAPFEWNNTKVNLIDTPGLFDFAGGFYEGIRAAESVIIAVSGKSGITVGVEKAYKEATLANRSRMFFVTKLDTENADFYKVLENLKSTFGPSVCPLVVPYVEDQVVMCYINLIDMKAYKYDANGKPTEVPMPDTGHRVDGLSVAISEAVAETDEALFEKYFSGEQFTSEEIIKGIHLGVRKGSITPVFCGSGYTLAGIDMLLNGITTLLPSAQEAGGETGYGANDTIIDLPCDENGPLAAFVFKTIADPFVGKLSFFKVVSGKLTSDTTPINSRTGNPERLGKLIMIRGKKQEDIEYISAGDIGAVSKLSETNTGDTLCLPNKPVRLEVSKFPSPTLSMAIKLKKGDESKISQGLHRLMEEDLTLHFENNTETHQHLISGLGDQHLDVVVTKLKNKFGIDVELEPVRVAYRETIRKKVKVEGKHKKQTGGHGQFGHVWIEFEPNINDEFAFDDKVFGGSVPKSFFPAVEKGLRESIIKGVLAGYPVVGLKATLVDGSYHPVDSSEMSFKVAAQLAYRAGLPLASPIILEPIGNLKVQIPESYTGDIIGDINKRRGRVLGMNPSEDNNSEIEAEVPMSEMLDFTTVLRSMTHGRGNFALKFERYEPLPQQLEAAVIESSKKLNTEE